MRTAIILTACCLMVAGCDHEQRIAALEKQSQELKTELAKNKAAADFDFQSKCSRDAKAWFNENWAGTKDAALLDYTNHFNKAQNKCFILVEYHYSIDKKTGSWIGDLILYDDVYENSKYGDFSENHWISLQPKIESGDHVSECEVYGKKCTTEDEFNGLIRSYMND